MVTLNKSKKSVSAQALKQEQTTNYHGEVAYKLNAHEALIERVVGAFWKEDLFYSKGKKIAKAIVEDIQAVAKTDPKFVLQLAVYARQKLYLRTTPQVLLVEAATIAECKPFIREYAPKIIQRADELADVVAYYVATRGTKKGFPNSLKDGVAKAFSNFDEYQLNKYDSDKAAVSIGDVVKLVHPFGDLPAAKAKALYNYLTKDEVDAENLPKIAALKALLGKDKLDEEALGLAKESGATWETLTSKFGSTKEVWNLATPNMGYMALLRNLRNLIEKGADLDNVLDRIQNEKAVKNSKQLPFRFYSAYNEVNDQKVRRAIANAFEHSISNVTLEGDTAIFVDLSGSMSGGKISAKSNITYVEISTLMGAMAAKKSERSHVIGFGSTAAEAKINPDDRMLTNMDIIRKLPVGHATQAIEAFRVLGNTKVDRIILLSDMQCYGGSVENAWKNYLKTVNKDAWLYSVDLSAYGTSLTPSNANHVVKLNGWSDKILDLIQLSEKTPGAMIKDIRNY